MPRKRTPLKCKPCQQCGTMMNPDHPVRHGPVRWAIRLFCSNVCRATAHGIDMTVAVPAEKNCEACGLIFSRRLPGGRLMNMNTWRKQVCCSKKCGDIYRKRHSRQLLGDKKCVECKAAMTYATHGNNMRPGAWQARTYCSHTCANASTARKLQIKKIETKTCLYCSREFINKHEHGGWIAKNVFAKQKTCSKACAKQHDSDRHALGFLDRFHARVDSSGGPTACWPYTGMAPTDGYGAVKVKGGAAVGAHRIAFAASGQGIEKHQVVRHDCDNRLCCNPAHLRAGSRAENVSDRIKRGRSVYVNRDNGHGCGNTTAKMIMALTLYFAAPKYANGFSKPGTTQSIAEAFGIRRSTLMGWARKAKKEKWPVAEGHWH